MLVTKCGLRRLDLSSNLRLADSDALLLAAALLHVPEDTALEEVVLLDCGLTRVAGRVRGGLRLLRPSPMD